MIAVVLGGFWIVWTYGRWPAVRQAWPQALIISAIYGIGQIVVALIDPVLAEFLPATVVMAALYPLSRWQALRATYLPSETTPCPFTSRGMKALLKYSRPIGYGEP